MNKVEASAADGNATATNVAEGALAEEITSVSLSSFVKELFPEIRDTPIPDCVMAIVSGIEPLTKPLHDKDKITFTEGYALIRGSTIKRKLWGTPRGFWDVSRLFKTNRESLLGNDRAVNAVVEKLAFGPRDLDVRYYYKTGLGYGDMRLNIDKSLTDFGFLKNIRDGKFYMKDDEHKYSVTIGIDHIGREDVSQRIFFNVMFSIDNENIFQLDLGDFPVDHQYEDDFRYSGFYPAIEYNTLGVLTRGQDGSVQLKIDKNKEKTLLDKWHYKIFTSDLRFLIYVHATLRALNPTIFWSQNLTTDNDNFAHIADLLSPLVWQSWESRLAARNTPDEQQAIKAKKGMVITESIVYLTFDPLLFLATAYYVNLLQTMPLGKLINGPIPFRGMLHALSEELGEEHDLSPHDCILFQDPALVRLSNKYKDKLIATQDIYESGPFLLLRALKKTNLIPQDTPETMEEVVKLFDVGRI